MRGSFRVAKIFGIDLKIHFTFFIIVVLAFMQGRTTEAQVFGVAFILLLFVCVTLHELGHSLVAKHYGIEVREIVLLPIGGVAMLGRIPANPTQELLIAIAGPLVNVVILAVLVPASLAVVGVHTGLHEVAMAFRFKPPGGESWGPTMLLMLIYTNFMLIAFNLIPAFPLDGGRIFRATLAYFMPHAKATRIAAAVGQMAAIGIGTYGLLNQQYLMAIIAFFIFTGAGAESSAAQAGTVLSTRRAGDAYNKTAISLTIDNRVSHVIEHLLTSYQPDFAVINRGKLVGVVTRADVLKWLAETPSMYDVFVTEVMVEEAQIVKVDARLTLDEVSNTMTERDTRIVAVTDADHYLGLMSSEDLDEAQAVLTYLNRRLEGGQPPVRGSWPVPMQKEMI